MTSQSSQSQTAETNDLPAVTILIDTYNYGHLIGRAIESAIGQTYPAENIEVLVVDDGSTDGTAAVVERYGERVRYILKPNGGQASALNRGFREARGEIVCLLDADDYFYPDKVARVVEVFRSDPAIGVVYNKLDVIDAGGARIKETWPTLTWSGDLEARTLLGYSWGCPTSAISLRRSLLQDLEVPEDAFRICPDYFLTSILPLRAQVGVVESAESTWVFHGDNQGLFSARFDAGYGEMTRVQHEAIRNYAERRLGKRFVTYLGKSAYGTGAEMRGLAAVATFLRELSQIVTARVDRTLKLEATLKLMACTLPASQYERLKARKNALVSWYVREIMRTRPDHDINYKALNEMVATVLNPASYLRTLRALRRPR